MTYGGETRILNREMEMKLLISEKKILGGIKMEHGICRRTTNNEVAETFNTTNIIQVVKAQRLR